MTAETDDDVGDDAAAITARRPRIRRRLGALFTAVCALAVAGSFPQIA